MISVRRAFTGHTTTEVIFQREVAGSYDLNNNWVAGGFSPPVPIHVTPLPYGNREDGILGDQLVPSKTGERIPSYMQVHSPEEIEINAYLTIYGDVYKVIRKGNYMDAGYWSTLCERKDKSTFPAHSVTINGILEV